MGKVVAKIKLTNYLDLELKRLKLRREKPRAVQTDALVDTGATRLYLKRSVIKALGLRKEGEVVSKTTNGTRRRSVYQAARLELMGRYGAFEVVEIDDDVKCPRSTERLAPRAPCKDSSEIRPARSRPRTVCCRSGAVFTPHKPGHRLRPRADVKLFIDLPYVGVDWLRVSRFLSASMVVYLRFNCRF